MKAPRRARKGTSRQYPPLPPLGEKRIWAADLGRRTGWMVRGPGNFQESGVHSLYDPRGERQNYEDGDRFLALAKFLDQLEGKYNRPDVIAFEDVHPSTHRSARQTNIYQGFRATFMQWGAIRGIPIVPIPIQTIKIAVTGNGNATKDQVVTAIRARGYLPFDDNEADAIAIMHALTQIALDAAQNGIYKCQSVNGKRDSVSASSAASKVSRHKPRRGVAAVSAA